MLPQISCRRRFIFHRTPLDKLRNTGAPAPLPGVICRKPTATKAVAYQHFRLQRTRCLGSMAVALFAARVARSPGKFIVAAIPEADPPHSTPRRVKRRVASRIARRLSCRSNTNFAHRRQRRRYRSKAVSRGTHQDRCSPKSSRTAAISHSKRLHRPCDCIERVIGPLKIIALPRGQRRPPARNAPLATPEHNLQMNRRHTYRKRYRGAFCPSPNPDFRLSGPQHTSHQTIWRRQRLKLISFSGPPTLP